MIKKLASFLAFLMPFTANAEVIETGSSKVVGSEGMNYTNVYVGQDPGADSPEVLYIGTGTDIPFTMLSGGDITFSSGLTINTNRVLTVGTDTSNFPTLVNMTVGTISLASGSELTIHDIDLDASFTENLPYGVFTPYVAKLTR